MGALLPFLPVLAGLVATLVALVAWRARRDAATADRWAQTRNQVADVHAFRETLQERAYEERLLQAHLRRAAAVQVPAPRQPAPDVELVMEADGSITAAPSSPGGGDAP